MAILDHFKTSLHFEELSYNFVLIKSLLRPRMDHARKKENAKIYENCFISSILMEFADKLKISVHVEEFRLD